ncbi:MAG: precorrin-3B synthase, partial [Pseudomonadota bacterium]
AFSALCAAAEIHGNGLMEITTRGSLQIHGLTDTSAPRFAETVQALDILFDDNLPIVISPLPINTASGRRLAELASEICKLAAASTLKLAPKVSVLIDDGGPVSLDGIDADIRLRAIDAGTMSDFVLSVGGDGETGTTLGAVEHKDAVAVVTDMLALLASRGPQTRARAILEREGLRPFLSAGGARIGSQSTRHALRQSETIGLHRLDDGRCAIGIALPFGQAAALDLIALARIAGANGAAWAAFAPQRTLLLGPIGEMTAFALATAADTLGFITDARDSRRRIAACAGAPACTSGHIPSRRLAAQIAKALPQGQFALHISGCTKGCAHPKSSPLTLVGTEQGACFVGNQVDGPVSAYDLTTDGLALEAVRRISAENENA